MTSSSALDGDLAMAQRLFILVVLSIAGCGFDVGGGGGGGFQPVASKADIDTAIEEDLADYQQKPAIECLQSGAEHMTAEVDKGVLIPLCQRLESEYKVKTIALIDEEEDDKGVMHPYVFEIVVDMPADATAQASVLNAIREADSKYDGRIEITYGVKRLAFVLYEVDEID